MVNNILNADDLNTEVKSFDWYGIVIICHFILCNNCVPLRYRPLSSLIVSHKLI